MSKFATATASQFEELRKRLEEKQASVKKPETEDKGKFDYKFNPELKKDQTTAQYVIRILPHIFVNEGIDEPYVQNLVHIFKPKGAEKNTYQICPHHKDPKAKCPICEHSKMWFAKKDKVSEDIGRLYWKKKRWHANVYVKSDPRKGEENQQGKVLIWEFGPKIMEKLSSALNMHKMFYWNVEDGYDFNLVVKKVGGHNNYDSSDFSREKSRLVEDDDAVDAIHDKIYNLNEKVLGQKIKSYDDLKCILEGRKIEEVRAESSETKLRDSDAPNTVEKDVEPNVGKVDVGEVKVAETKAPPKPAGKPSEGEIDIDKINFDEPPF